MKSKKRTLILYTYHEGCKNAICNITFFLRNGLIKDDRYTFYININGKSKLNFEPYLKRYKNLKIVRGNGKCGWDGWKNIISKVNIRDYKYFIFIKDNVLGPRRTHLLECNWIDSITKNIIENQDVIIGGYGTISLKRIYKFPYATEKFFCTNRNVVKLMLKKKLFEKNHYDFSHKLKVRVINIVKNYCSKLISKCIREYIHRRKKNIEKYKKNIKKVEVDKEYIKWLDSGGNWQLAVRFSRNYEMNTGICKIDYLRESSSDIELTHFLLENNFNYVSYDINRVYNINILKLYREKNKKEMERLVDSLYEKQDKSIRYRLFWTNKSTEKGFLRNSDKIEKRKKSCKMSRW